MSGTLFRDHADHSVKEPDYTGTYTPLHDTLLLRDKRDLLKRAEKCSVPMVGSHIS